MGTFSPAFIIADAHGMHRRGLTNFLKQHFKGCTVAEVTNANDLLAATQQHWFNIILIDVRLPHLNGFETARQLKQLFANCCLVLYGAEQNEELKMRAFTCGAASFFYTYEPEGAVMAKIAEVLEKGFSVTAENFRTYQREHKRLEDSTNIILTQREKEILLFLKKGYTSIQIAADLSISKRTVENHRHHLMHKTKCHNTPQLLLYSQEHGLL
jgi:DNA-binding NarL/FixJ family response regulator